MTVPITTMAIRRMLAEITTIFWRHCRGLFVKFGCVKSYFSYSSHLGQFRFSFIIVIFGFD